ncbi:hypothetical protein PPSIR1_29158 [Plesiocystis pacifica SIR-1]|uniref:Uncharacterized protein n=1 Tax=Plesiocystis pacifica SIR-1 TaxID=391625 RepID=A6GHW3_9BACT|nr:hypothetical protein [Plesiocystis pacifica]EDM74560.1 hypothetical protein PPSIR1_29158 [Plesiocystis pacifica SIR-1]
MTQPIDELLATLEAAERSAPDPDAATAERVWQDIETRLRDGPPPPPLDDGPLFSAPPKGGGFGVLKVVGGLALLAAVGLGASASLGRPDAPAPTLEAPTPARLVAPLAEVEAEPEPELGAPPVPPDSPTPEPPEQAAEPEPQPAPTEPAATPKSKGKSKAKPAPAEPKTLADELALMQAINAALKANDPGETLDRVREHERDFPEGQFVEERRAAKARALCRRGKTQAGRKEAARFEARWPGSIHLASIRDDCGLE